MFTIFNADKSATTTRATKVASRKEFQNSSELLKALQSICEATVNETDASKIKWVETAHNFLKIRRKIFLQSPLLAEKLEIRPAENFLKNEEDCYLSFFDEDHYVSWTISKWKEHEAKFLEKNLWSELEKDPSKFSALGDVKHSTFTSIAYISMIANIRGDMQTCLKLIKSLD